MTTPLCCLGFDFSSNLFYGLVRGFLGSNFLSIVPSYGYRDFIFHLYTC